MKSQLPRKMLSLLCAVGMLVSVLTNPSIAFADGDEVVSEATTIEQDGEKTKDESGRTGEAGNSLESFVVCEENTGAYSGGETKEYKTAENLASESKSIISTGYSDEDIPLTEITSEKGWRETVATEEGGDTKTSIETVLEEDASKSMEGFTEKEETIAAGLEDKAEEYRKDVVSEKKSNNTGVHADEDLPPEGIIDENVEEKTCVVEQQPDEKADTKEKAVIEENTEAKHADSMEREQSSVEEDITTQVRDSAESLTDNTRENPLGYNSELIIGTATHNGVTVNVTAPVNSFPEGTTVAVEKAFDEEDRTGFDITFINAEGAKVQPENGLNVTVHFSISAASSHLSIDGTESKLIFYHKKDDGAVEQLKSIITSEDFAQIEVSASHFSEYGVISERTGSIDDGEEWVQTRGTKSATSTNLEDFLVDVIIDAPTNENGNYIINPNSSYEMTFKFSENEGIQFDDDAVLTYDFPAGLVVGDMGQTTFSIEVTDENGTVTVNGNTIEVVEGQLRVRFNQNDLNYERLKATANVKFDISISSSIDQTAGEIAFSPTVVKDFVFEENSDLTITKNVEYDMDSDTAYYAVKVTSAGTNENVVIEDRLTGTALIFNQDVSVESSINGTLSVTPDYTAVENGYQVTIPQMTNGEVLTIRYSATVDNTKITGNGTVSQTNNTARVTSEQVPDGKEADANFAGQVTFDKIDKTTVEPAVDLGGGLYEQTWTIFINDDHKLPMGDINIFDWIVESSRPFMQFTGDGIRMTVTMEDGTTENRTVSWDELNEVLTDSNGIYGWVYHTPDTDGKASYVITCKTIIDTNGALGNLTLRNGAQVHYMYDEGSVLFEGVGEDRIDIKKEAIGTTSTESEWEITVTVPGSGLPDLRVVDDLPKITHNGQEYLDNYIEGSMTVEGLLEGESWTVALNSAGNSFTVNFYQDEAQTQGGVLPTENGESREIVIRFKTSVNQDWLTLAADDGYTSSNLYTHTNVTNARSGSYKTYNATASVIPIKPNLQKIYVERTDAEVDGVTYPVFRYTLRLFGPTEDGIVISDSFNTDYLKYYEAEGVQILGGNNYNPTNGGGAASVTETTDGMDIAIQSFPKQAGGDFYKIYTVSYALIVKDQEALSTLNEEAASSQTGVDLKNTATWGSLESSSYANYTYFPYVDKELVTRPTEDNGYVAEFKVVINKYAEDLDPTSDVLTILDELSPNLRFIPDSLLISPANESIGVQHDEESNTLIFTDVPDNTTYEITYQARVLGSGNVSYSNTIKFGKYEKTIEETTTVTSSGGGSASNPSITLIKRDADNLSTTLSGATFQLFYLDNTGTQVPVQDRNGENVTFTTGSDGTVLIVGNQQSLGWTLWTDRTYCLVETTPPAGYDIAQEMTYFILKEHPSSQMEFDITGDQLSIQNERIKISVSVEKEWVGPEAEAVTMQLLKDGAVVQEVELNEGNGWQHTFTELPKFDSADGHEIVYDVQEVTVPGYEQGRSGSVETGFTFTNTITGKVSVPVTKTWIGPAAESVTVELLADGVKIAAAVLNEDNGWQYTFTDLEQYNNGVEIIYTIREVNIEGYSAEISGSVNDGFSITNTNTETISIPIVKQWIGPVAEEEMLPVFMAALLTRQETQETVPVVLMIQLLADGNPVAATYLYPEDGYVGSFEDLPKYDAVDGHEIEYSIIELNVPDGYAVEVSVNPEGGFIITNTNTEAIEIPVIKQWVGPAAESVIVNLLADGEPVDEVELNAGNDWQYSFTDLLKYDSTDGHEIVYDVQEVPVPGYEQGRSGSVETGFTFTNTISGKVSVPVTKTWIGPSAESATVELLADGVKIADAVLNEDNGWQYTFTDLDQYNNGVEIVYAVREVSIDGYSTEITGDQSGYTITNTNTEARSVPVEKRWVGTAAENATIRLYADGVEVASVVINKDNNWMHTFADLQKYDGTDGHEIVYTITEDSINGYTTSIKGDMSTGFVVTNTKTTTPPAHDTPKTGDDSHLLFYYIMMLFSGIGLIWMILMFKRRSHHQKS